MGLLRMISSPPKPGVYIEANAIAMHDNANDVKFVHACLGYPSHSTFLRAVRNGGVRHGPPSVLAFDAENGAEVRFQCHVHTHGQGTFARLRHHTRETRNKKVRFVETHMKTATHIEAAPFVHTEAPRSTRLDVDYTCFFKRCFFKLACGVLGISNLQPLRSLRAEHTVPALKATVDFYCHHKAKIEKGCLHNMHGAIFSRATNVAPRSIAAA
jgi:hypothetical protein